MKVTFETLSAIFRIAKHFANIDGELKSEEVRPVYDFFQTFEGMTDENLQNIIDYANEGMTDERALELIMGMDTDAKQQISDLLADIIGADGVLTEDEQDIYDKLRVVCGLPEPTGSSVEEDDEEEEESEADPDDGIVPAFILVKSNGHVEIKQSENEDWNTLGDEIAEWIGADRVEVVRFTPALNALTEKLRLNERHLVFMVDRNFSMKSDELGDNMPGTILYGRGYEILGNIVIAIETDSGYEIEGIITRSLLNEVLDAVDEAVDNLLSYE